MLGKLLKYDLKWCFKPLIVFYILALIFSVIIRIVESFEQTTILVIIDKLCCGIGIAMVVNIVINCFMRNWARFIKNVYKDESYLTHTLPVSKSKIYLSKILTTLITLFVSIIVIITCVGVSSLNEETWNYWKFSLEQASQMLNIPAFGIIAAFIGVTFLEAVFMYMCGIFGITIGYKTNNAKIIKSIVIGIASYMVLSNITVGIVFVIGLINPNIMELFKTTQIEPNVIMSLGVIALFIYAIYDLILYFVGNKILNKGVNVD